MNDEKKIEVGFAEIPDVIKKEVEGKMQGIGASIDSKIPDGWGFACLVFPFGDADDDRILMYVSNADRANIVEAFKEWIQKAGIN